MAGNQQLNSKMSPWEYYSMTRENMDFQFLLSVIGLYKIGVSLFAVIQTYEYFIDARGLNEFGMYGVMESFVYLYCISLQIHYGMTLVYRYRIITLIETIVLLLMLGMKVFTYFAMKREIRENSNSSFNPQGTIFSNKPMGIFLNSVNKLLLGRLRGNEALLSIPLALYLSFMFSFPVSCFFAVVEYFVVKLE